jgi:hypothetical protein
MAGWTFPDGTVESPPDPSADMRRRHGAGT